MQEYQYETSIARGKEFALCMATLRSKGKDLKRKGKGNKEHAADSLSDDEVNILYSSGQLGNHCPEALINTLWYNNTLHFGIRGGGTEHRQVLITYIVITLISPHCCIISNSFVINNNYLND